MLFCSFFIFIIYLYMMQKDILAKLAVKKENKELKPQVEKPEMVKTPENSKDIQEFMPSNTGLKNAASEISDYMASNMESPEAEEGEESGVSITINGQNFGDAVEAAKSLLQDPKVKQAISEMLEGEKTGNYM